MSLCKKKSFSWFILCLLKRIDLYKCELTAWCCMVCTEGFWGVVFGFCLACYGTVEGLRCEFGQGPPRWAVVEAEGPGLVRPRAEVWWDQRAAPMPGRCFARRSTQTLHQSEWLEHERQAGTRGSCKCKEEPLWRNVRGAVQKGCAALESFRVLLRKVLSNLLWSHSCSCSQEGVELEVFQAFSDLFSSDPLYLACVVIAGCLIEARRTRKGWQKYSYCMISVSKRFMPCTAIHFHSFELWAILIVVSEVPVKPDTPTELKNSSYELALKNSWRSHPESSSHLWAVSHWSFSTENWCVRCSTTKTQLTSSILKKKLKNPCQGHWTHSNPEYPSCICWKLPCGFASSPVSSWSWVMVVLFSFNLLKY